MKKIYLLFFTFLLGVWSVDAQYRELSKAGWTVAADNEEVTNEYTPASYAIDENTGTFWGTDWDDTAFPLPHWIAIDMGRTFDLAGFTYYPRPGGGNGTVSEYAFYTSADSTAGWDSITGGVWTDNWDQPRQVVFDHVVTGVRYVKFVAKAERNGHGWTTCAELSPFVQGADFTSDKTEIGLGETVQFTDESGNNPTAWEWSFPGGTPSTSTDQNPQVTYNTAGSYDVQLISKPDPGDNTTWDTLLMKEYIVVLAPNISRTDWVKLYVDSEQSGRPAENVWDGDPSTFWHTDWSTDNPPYPHTLVIDLGAKYSINGFIYTPRPGGGNGTVKDYEFYVLDKEALWSDPNTWGEPVASGAWDAPWAEDKRVFLDKPVVGRYLVFYPLSERNGNNWASCAELNVMGTLFGSAFSADRTEIYATQKVQFTDRSLQKKEWYWTFEGGTPATSTEQNPVVQYKNDGVYDVTLVTVSQSDERDTLYKSEYITVKARPKNKPLEKEGWSVIAFDSQEEPYGRWASNVIDGDITTFWHTAWSQEEPDYPHWLIIDMGKNEDISGFIYYPRPGGGNGTVDSCLFLTSIDAEIWDTVARCDWVGLDDWASPRTVTLDNAVTGRFVKFVALSEKNDNAWASCGEIEVLTPISGTYFEGEPVSIESGDKVYFVDLTAGTPTAWEWTFENGEPATSTEQSPAVTYNIPYKDLGKSFDVSLTVNGETYTRENYVYVNYKVPKVGGGVYIDTLEIGKAFAFYAGKEGGYVDHTDMQFTLVRGRTYVVRMGHRSPWKGYWRSRGLAVDWNGNMHFDPESEMVFSTQNSVPLFDTMDLFYLKVPEDAALGLTRVRTWATVYGSVDPYGDVPYGQMDDFTVNIADSATVAPVAAFDADTTELCAGGEVKFKDISENVPEKWAWKFEGGTPDTSNFANPVVTYDTPGTYSVTLVASNSVGSDEVTMTGYITVYGSTPVNAGDDMKVCPGTEVVLTATGTDSLRWNHGVVNGEPFYPTDSMAYVVTGVNEHNCSATDTVIVALWEGVTDTSVTKYGEDTLIVHADPSMYVFQWINCDDGTAIDGETDTIFVAQHGGNYAVVVTQVDGGQCSDTSLCYNITISGINDHFGDQISIYPNPNDGSFTIQIGKEHSTISVYNAVGTMIFRKEDAATVEEMSIRTKGVYFVKIENDGQVETRRVVVR